MNQEDLVDLFDPSHSYLCEHADHPEELTGLTFRTESSERYCADHFPWEDETERRAVEGIIEERCA